MSPGKQYHYSDVGSGYQVMSVSRLRQRLTQMQDHIYS